MAEADGPLILVADDVAANVELLCDQLHSLGYRTVGATDGMSALQTCVASQPDLCLLDVPLRSALLEPSCRHVVTTIVGGSCTYAA